MIFDVRIEIEDLHDFKEIKALFESTYSHRKIYEVSLLNVD
jgi:hypothetical protein